MTKQCNNPVGYLDEFSQKHKNKPMVRYADCTSALGEYTIKCMFDNHEVMSSAQTKKRAKKNAAESMITLLQKENYFENLNLNEKSLNRSLSKGVCVTQVSSTCTRTNNPISALNEYCQFRQTDFPVYTHTPVLEGGFVYQCNFEGKETHSYASTKKSAKTKAAFEMCKILNLMFGEEDLLKEKSDFQVGKNAVRVLDDILALSSVKAVYELRPSIMNFFVVNCTVGEISGEGMDTTKKGAKISAANQVLQKLSTDKKTEILVLKSVKEDIFLPVVNFTVGPYTERKMEKPTNKDPSSATLNTNSKTCILEDLI